MKNSEVYLVRCGLWQKMRTVDVGLCIQGTYTCIYAIRVLDTAIFSCFSPVPKKKKNRVSSCEKRSTAFGCPENSNGMSVIGEGKGGERSL